MVWHCTLDGCSQHNKPVLVENWNWEDGTLICGECGVDMTFDRYEIPATATNDALNAMLRCFDYGKSTKPAEWEAAAAQARVALGSAA